MPYFPPIQQEQYPATDETQCIEVIIPAGDEFKALLAGLIASASDVRSYADPESVAADGQAAIWDTAYSLIDWVGCPPEVILYPTIDLFCINSELLSGAGTLTYNASATLPFGYAISNTNNSGYGMENFVWLPAGEYDYDGWASLITNGGNTVVAVVDGASTIDTIIASVSQAGTFGTRVHHTGSFTIPDDGLYRIVAANDGTGGGGNRQMNWTSHHMRRVP